MPTFDTPGPISVQLDLPVGEARFKASDRADTVVTVRATDATSKADLTAAEQTRVDFADGRLLVKVPKSWRRYSLFGSGPSVDVVIELPTGSHVQAEAAWTALRSEGQLGDCRLHTGGEIHFGQTGALEIDTSSGDVRVDQIVGPASVTTGSGKVRLREVTGSAVIKNSSGECWVGSVTEEVRINTASGDVTVERALGDVAARTAYGSVRIGEVTRGTVVLQTSYGDIDVVVAPGTAAWLDVTSRYGRVFNELALADGPAATDETVKITGVTSYGNVTVRRR